MRIDCSSVICLMSYVDHCLNIFIVTEEKLVTCLILNTSQFFFKVVSRILEQLFWNGGKWRLKHEMWRAIILYVNDYWFLTIGSLVYTPAPPTCWLDCHLSEVRSVHEALVGTRHLITALHASMWYIFNYLQNK